MGYMYQIYPYPQMAEKPTSGGDLGASGNVVYFLMKNIRQQYPERPLHVCMDNYFTSIKLLKMLQEQNVVATNDTTESSSKFTDR